MISPQTEIYNFVNSLFKKHEFQLLPNLKNSKFIILKDNTKGRKITKTITKVKIQRSQNKMQTINNGTSLPEQLKKITKKKKIKLQKQRDIPRKGLTVTPTHDANPKQIF